MTEREIFKEFVKISEDRLNTKSNKKVFVENNIMTHIIKHCKNKKKRYKKIDRFSKNYIFQIMSIEHKVKSKKGTIFVNEDILKEYSVKIYEIDLYFSENYKEKYKSIITVNNMYCLELIFILLNVV